MGIGSICLKLHNILCVFACYVLLYSFEVFLFNSMGGLIRQGFTTSAGTIAGKEERILLSYLTKGFPPKAES